MLYLKIAKVKMIQRNCAGANMRLCELTCEFNGELIGIFTDKPEYIYSAAVGKTAAVAPAVVPDSSKDCCQRLGWKLQDIL